MVMSWSFRGAFMDYHRSPMVLHGDVCGLTGFHADLMVVHTRSWCFHGAFTARNWRHTSFHGAFMGLSWGFHGAFMGLPWGFHGASMGLGFPWNFDGVFMVLSAFRFKFSIARTWYVF